MALKSPGRQELGWGTSQDLERRRQKEEHTVWETSDRRGRRQEIPKLGQAVPRKQQRRRTRRVKRLFRLLGSPPLRPATWFRQDKVAEKYVTVSSCKRSLQDVDSISEDSLQSILKNARLSHLRLPKSTSRLFQIMI
jgi:hypothetical protein